MDKLEIVKMFFFFKYISAEGVQNVLTTFDAHKVYSLDDNRTQIQSCIADLIVLGLASLFNPYPHVCSAPSDWRLAAICSIFKMMNQMTQQFLDLSTWCRLQINL